MYTNKDMIVKLISCVVILQMLFNNCSASCDANLQACTDNILSRTGHTYDRDFYLSNSNWRDDINGMSDITCNIAGNPYENQKISEFDVSEITDFSSCFSTASLTYRNFIIHFDLNNWDVSKGTNFKRMFYTVQVDNHINSVYFNEYDKIILSDWNVSSGTNFDEMFADGHFKNLDLNNWHILNSASVTRMLPDNQRNLLSRDLTGWFSGDLVTQSRVFAKSNAITSEWGEQNSCRDFNYFYTQDSVNNINTRSCTFVCANIYDGLYNFDCPYPKLKTSALLYYGSPDEREEKCCYNPCDDFPADTTSRLSGTRIEYKVGDDCHYADASVIGVAKEMIDDNVITLNSECQLQN